MKLLVTLPMDDAHRASISAAAPTADITFLTPKEVTPELLETAEAILGNVSPSLLKHCKHLKWMQLQMAGANLFTPAGILPEGTVLTCATGSFGPVIAEYMLGYLLNLYLHLDQYRDEQNACTWSDKGGVRSIYGSSALMIGMGDIGMEFAKRFHALGGKVTGVKRTQGEKPDCLEGLYTMDALPDLLGQADIVASALPQTAATKDIYGKAFFAKMKPGAVFINVGRGCSVVEADLAEALESGHLSGAALDVFQQEPLSQESPLWRTKNLIITPHIAGNLNLPATYERIFEICRSNLKRYVLGKPLCHVVDFKTGYETHD